MRTLLIGLCILLVIIVNVQACPEHKVDRSKLPEHLRTMDTKGFNMATCIYHYESDHKYIGDQAAYYCLALKHLADRGEIDY